MVRQGDFTVQLVDAVTMQPFQEHIKQSDGTHYVEVEPNAEYWIQVISHTANENRVCTYEVDGSDLHYITHLKKDRRTMSGIWSQAGLISTKRALKVSSALLCQNNDNDDNDNDDVNDDQQQQEKEDGEDNSFWIGTVKVKIHRSELLGVKKIKDMENRWKGGKNAKQSTAAAAAAARGKKMVASLPGTNVTTHTVSDCKRKYRAVKLLDIITLRYCTAVGLIHAGILPGPESLQVASTSQQRNVMAARLDDDDEPDDDEMEVIADQVRSHSEILVQKKETNTTIDLTKLEEDEEEEDSDDEMVEDRVESAHLKLTVAHPVVAKSEF